MTSFKSVFWASAWIVAGIIAIIMTLSWAMAHGIHTDNGYEGYCVKNKKVDLVVARYNEDIGWLAPLAASGAFDRVFVYNKGPHYELENKGIPGAYVVQLDNVGREGHAYLFHIIDHYDDMADVTIFLPGSCDRHDKWSKAAPTIARALETMDSTMLVHHADGDVQTSLFDFAIKDWRSTHGKNAQANPESTLELNRMRPFGIWYQKMFGNLELDAVCYNGIFAVSKEHVHNRTMGFYQALEKELDTHSNPEAGHFLERAWPAVFAPLPHHCLVYS